MEDIKPKVFAHGSYIGTGGYNNHTRDFFRHLSKLIDVKVRNFTVGETWNGLNNEPHNNESYINNVDKQLLCQQTLWEDNTETKYNVYDIYKNSNNFKHNVNIILNETNHHFFYDKYVGPKIGYNVWESTLQPERFFNKWNEFDQLWVPSQWQADCTIKQGADYNKVKVVPEGVDVNVFYPEKVELLDEYKNNKFKFVLFGRWDYRKSTKEIIEAFIEVFGENDDVELIASIDNPFSGDGIESTEERLKHFNLDYKNIKIKHFPSREDYISYLKTGHVFLSCARSEGWNLPLIEAMACGTPSIYSECSGQMEFAEGKGLPVKIIEERPANNANYNHFNDVVGNYYEPDFDNLKEVMLDAYKNYDKHKSKALKDAKIIHENFNWDKVAEIGANVLNEFINNYKEPEDKNKIITTYDGGPKVEILGDSDLQYHIEFIDSDKNEVIHSDTISNNMWTKCSRTWFTNWVIKVNGKVIDEFNLKNKTVHIIHHSKSMGDCIAWAPYAVEFQKKHKCKVILSTFHNYWFENKKEYKNITFKNIDEEVKCYVRYPIGWFRSDNQDWDNPSRNPQQVNLRRLQQTATDILGLEFKELNFGIELGNGPIPMEGKYVVFAPQATAGCKEWEYSKWVELASKFKDEGYKVVVCSLRPWNIPNTLDINRSLETTTTYIRHANIFIGLGSGLSWINWAIGNYTYMINGFVKEGHEFTSNLTKITNDKCIKCWNDPVHVFDPGDWDWCPVYKGTKLQHICQKSITSDQVFNIIKKDLEIL